MAGNFLFASILCLALANAVRAQSVTEGVYNVTEVCTMVKVGTQVGSIVSCDYYYSCTSSGPVKKTCPSGYSYNFKTQNCLPSSQVECYYGVSNPCAGKTGNNWVPDVTDCQKWVYCVGEKISGSGSCAKGEIFDGSKQRCDYGKCPSNNGVGPSVMNYCSVIPPNIYFGSTNDCKVWMFCSPQGSLSTGKCASSAYIVSTGSCGYDSAPGACDRVVSLPVPSTCDKQGDVEADPTVCGNYYVCDGSKYVLNQCNYGSYYDIYKKNCATRQSASPISTCNRCQYASSAFVNAPNYQNCDSYYYCNNGKNGDTSTCKYGYFFNENDQVCAPNSGLPSYASINGACRGASGTTTAAPSSDSTTTTTVPPSSDPSTESNSGEPSTSTDSSGPADSSTTEGSAVNTGSTTEGSAVNTDSTTEGSEVNTGSTTEGSADVTDSTTEGSADVSDSTTEESADVTDSTTEESVEKTDSTTDDSDGK